MRGLGQRQQAVLVTLLALVLTLLLLPLLMLDDLTDRSSRRHALDASKSAPLAFAGTDSSAVDFRHARRVSWAIPVGGRTQRLDRLQSLLRDLITGGAGRSNVFVFEDDGSRDGPSPALAAITRAWGVHLLQSAVKRGPEPPELFGLHLARHYHYMMDSLLLTDGDRESLTSPSQAPRHYGYDYMVILEDDLKLAPDSVKYFHSMASVMDADNSLLCVCAHADNAFYASTRSELELIMAHHHHNVRKQSAHAANNRTVNHGVRSADIGFGSLDFGLEGLEALAVDEDAEPFEHEHGTQSEDEDESQFASPLLTLASSEFDFRRGQHFMAPGWMTSRRVYHAIRPAWFDHDLNLPFKAELNMPNGNWDAFMDAQAFHRKMECLYPEIPRVAHQGANGYTVSAAMQAELFDNLRLSSMPSSIDYGDLTRLELANYDKHILTYIAGCTRVSDYPSIGLYRRSNLCLLLPTASDKDALFVDLFSHYFGLVSIGGHANYGKMRGIHHGSVFTRWLTNLVLVIGAHSPFAEPFHHLHSVPGEQALLDALESERSQTQTPSLATFYVGCFQDDRTTRVLPFHLASLSPVRPLACLAACQLRGYSHSGVEWGWECWCGHSDDVSDSRKRSDKQCNSRCVDSWEAKMRDANNPSLEPFDEQCGGDFHLSVLTGTGNSDRDSDSVGTSGHWQHLKRLPRAVHQLESRTADVTVIAGIAGGSCDDSCAAATPSMSCDDALLALIHDDCDRLRSLLGCRECHAPQSPWEGFAAPGIQSAANDSTAPSACVLSRGKYLRCSAVPREAGFRRACACVRPMAA